MVLHRIALPPVLQGWNTCRLTDLKPLARAKSSGVSGKARGPMLGNSELTTAWMIRTHKNSGVDGTGFVGHKITDSDAGSSIIKTRKRYAVN